MRFSGCLSLRSKRQAYERLGRRSLNPAQSRGSSAAVAAFSAATARGCRRRGRVRPALNGRSRDRGCRAREAVIESSNLPSVSAEARLRGADSTASTAPARCARAGDAQTGPRRRPSARGVRAAFSSDVPMRDLPAELPRENAIGRLRVQITRPTLSRRPRKPRSQRQPTRPQGPSPRPHSAPGSRAVTRAGLVSVTGAGRRSEALRVIDSELAEQFECLFVFDAFRDRLRPKLRVPG